MGFFSNLFKKEKLIAQHERLGEFKSSFIRGDDVGWNGIARFGGHRVELLLDGNRNGPFEECFAITLDVLEREPHYLSECEVALRDQYDNAEQEFVSTEQHFEFGAISVGRDSLEISFVEKEIVFHFNVHFKGDKQEGVSIDG